MATNTATLASQLHMDERDVQVVVQLLAGFDPAWRPVDFQAVPDELAQAVRERLDPGRERTAFAQR